MSDRRLRQTTRISYHELEEPSFDEYMYCDKCCDYVYEYCSIHGPLLVIPDDKIYAANNKPLHVVDGADVAHSNWMRYVNCARHCREQNLIAYQYQGAVYYRTIKLIPRSAELLVFYGSAYAGALNVDLRKYNSNNHYLEAIGYDPSPMKQVNKIETEQSQRIHYEEVTSTTTTTVEISSAECVYNENGTQEGHEIEDDFQYIDDTSNITEHGQVIEENQLKVEYNSEKHCFNIEFYNNDRNEFGEETKIENQAMLLDCHPQNHQLIHFNQIDSETQVNLKINTNEKHMQADFDPAKCSMEAENNQLKADASNFGNQPVDNIPYNAESFYFNNNATNSAVKNMFTKLVNEDKDKEQTDKESWQCNICHKILSKFSLSKHAKIHVDKTFNCTECNYKTHSKYQLNNHMHVHTGLNEFKCDNCPFTTNTGRNLKNHCRRMHENDNFICQNCSYIAASKLTMANHRSLHGKENVRKCDFCDYLTIKKRYLKNHVQAVHGNLKKVHSPNTDG